MSAKQINNMKIADLLPATLLFAGGVNWGLMGFFELEIRFCINERFIE